MNASLSLNHFALTAGDPEVELELHRDVLGLSTIDQTTVPAAGRQGTRFSFGVGGHSGFLQVTCLGADGRPGRLGSNGPKTANMSVPLGSLDFWQRQLYDAHLEAEAVTRFGRDRLEFVRGDGVGYSLVEDDAADAAPGAAGIAGEHAITGLHSVTISLMDVRETHDFLIDLLECELVIQELAWGKYRLSPGQENGFVELLHEPYRAPGTWKYAVGTPHHLGLSAGEPEQRAALCERLLDAGYPDVSAAYQDGDVSSVWVRAAGGTLIDLRCPSGHSDSAPAESNWVME